MAKKTLTRRQFLTYSAVGASAYSASGCAGLNQFFTGDSRNLPDEVVILGGGAAGLAAAFELKKRKVPFRLFEASSRVGGRVHTVQVLPESELVSEQGAEFFQDYHQTVRALIDELNLTEREVEPVAGLEPQLFYVQSRILKNRDFQSSLVGAKNAFRHVRADLFRNQDVQLTLQNARQFERSAYYDSLNLEDLLRSWQREVDGPLLKLIEIQAVNRFGVPASQQSALMFLSTLDSEGSSLLQSSKNYRLEGGLSLLMNSLAERVAGVIPDRLLKLQHELTEVQERNGIFQLSFKTPQGSQSYRTRRVICALPLTRLKTIRGFSDLNWQAPVAESVGALDYASHEKGHVLFASAFWRKPLPGVPGNYGNWTGDFKSQKIWHSGRSQKGEPALLTYQRVSSGNADFNTETQLRQDLGVFYKDLPPSRPGTFQNTLWKQRSSSLGSMLYYKPGQFAKYHGLYAQGFFEGAWQFAGEHVSDIHQGTLEGALQTGIIAARAFTGSVS